MFKFYVYFRGHSLTGKTAILHIVISGSSPDVSNLFLILAREAQPGRAELWRCLGCKFKSYLEQKNLYIKLSLTKLITFLKKIIKIIIGMLELADSFHLGLNGFNPCKFKSCYLYLKWLNIW